MVGLVMNRSQKVEDWLDRCRNPKKQLMEQLRETILAADDRIEETIMWKAPTFTYKGEIATMFPNATSFACLLFHDGKQIPGDYPSLLPENTTARTLRIRDSDDLAIKRDELIALVRSWCDMKDMATT